MKSEALNKLLNLLSKHVQTEEERGEINEIRNILKTRPDLSSRVEALCQSLSLLFTLPVIELVYASFDSVFREALSWCSDQKEFLAAVRCQLDHETMDRASACLIRSLVLRRTHNLKVAARWDEAARSIAKRLSQHTQMSWSQCNSAVTLSKIGNDLCSKGNLRKAEVAYKRAAELWPAWSHSWGNLGIIYVEQGKLCEALVMWKQALEKDRREWRAWDGVADIYCRQGNLEKAEGVVREGIEISLEVERLYEMLGQVQTLAGKPLLAISSYRRVLSIHPEVDHVWKSLGIAYENVRWYEPAVEAYRTSIALDPHTQGASLNLILLLLKVRKLPDAAEELWKYLVFQLKRARVAPLLVAKDFKHVTSCKLLTRYNIVLLSDSVDKLPGTGEHIIDQYLIIAQQCLFNGLKSRELQYRDVITGLFHIGVLWCLYGSRLPKKGPTKRFCRERLYAIKRDLLDGFPRESQIFGFTSVWPELEARMEKTTDEEFALEMLNQEEDWLESAGKRRKQGDIEDLRWRLQGNLWVHDFEYQNEQRSEHKNEHLERAHYYMELLKGHTVLHKLADPRILGKMIDTKKWNGYVDSLPVKIDKTAVIDLKACTESLPPNAVGLSFYFLRRELIDDRFLVIVLKPGQAPYLKTVKVGKRLEKFQDAAKRLKQVHHQVAWREKVPSIGDRLYDLLGVEKRKRKKELKGRELIRDLTEWEKKQLRQAYKAVLEEVIDVEELRGRDLYVSPSPEMYDIPFGLLMEGNEFLNQIVNSITIVPIFSLRQFQRKGYFPDKTGLILCLDERWGGEAKNRAKSLYSSWCNGVPHQKIEHGLLRSAFKGDVSVKYNEWIEAIVEMGYAHIIGHHDALQWSRPTKQNPNLGQFGRYLYEAPQKLSADLVSLEACWGGTWSNPEDLMGLFVSFLASGVSHIIASPYSVVPAATSGKLFEHIYAHHLETENGNIGLQMARAIRDAAEAVRLATLNSDDTIPTLWGAYQLCGAV